MELQMFLCKFVQMQVLHAIIINPYFYVGLIILRSLHFVLGIKTK